MQLEKVIGMSSKNNNSITINAQTGEFAYPAGSVIIIYNPKENRQSKFLHSRQGRSFSCVSYSLNGKYLIAGEGAFKQPEITIWEIDLSG